jgi:hypothetical protein
LIQHADVNKVSGDECVAAECIEVASQAAFILDSPLKEVEDDAWQLPSGYAAQILDVDCPARLHGTGGATIGAGGRVPEVSMPECISVLNTARTSMRF